MMSRSEQDRRANAIAGLVRKSMDLQGMTQEALARTIGMKTSALRSRLIYRRGAMPDPQMLASVSLALGFDARWLPGLLDGTYEFDDDPHNLPAPEPVRTKPKWSAPAVTPETREAARDRELRVAKAKIELLNKRLADLEAFVYAQPGVHRQAG